jgi:hypothetical protein
MAGAAECSLCLRWLAAADHDRDQVLAHDERVDDE